MSLKTQRKNQKLNNNFDNLIIIESKNSEKKNKYVGSIYWANNNKIDPFDKKERRQYAIVKDNQNYVKVAKVRGFNENDKNNDRLYELNIEKYPLSKRSGIDKKVYSIRADNHKPLKINDKQVFDNIPSFTLSSHDTHNVLVHTGMTSNKKRRR